MDMSIRVHCTPSFDSAQGCDDLFPWMLRGLRWGGGYAYVLAMHILNQAKVEFEFEYFNLHICINECKGAHEGKFREKCKFSHLYFFYNKRLFGRAHDHIPHLVAEKVVGIWIFTVLAPVDIDLGAAVAIMTRVIIRSCFSIADHTVAFTILCTRGWYICD